jgi:hypothetical protein
MLHIDDHHIGHLVTNRLSNEAAGKLQLHTCGIPASQPGTSAIYS